MGEKDHLHLSAITTILLRILLLYKLLTSIFLYLVPKKLRTYLPSSWYHQPQHHHQQKQIPKRVMDSNELKRVFQMFDKNGDGWITRDELSGSLENMGIFIPDDELALMIGKIDANGDGFVDMDEFEALYRNIIITGERDMDGEEDIREAFNVFDINGDGFITADELRSVLAGLGLEQGRAAEDCRKMIMKVDADGDGMVDFSEFKRMMRGGGRTLRGLKPELSRTKESLQQVSGVKNFRPSAKVVSC
ncbi:calmodulin-like protein [Striga asiatica]|uniref:Calmodulin-like protein n=1 Tax=Striga asiatica TaxID=4170 RepID=A0A5A7PK66_STRAF|nr:calmodulin-like protein [Striga asiatica]